MDNITIHTTTIKIKKLYENLSYTDQYGGSILLFFFLTAVTFFISGYFFIQLNSAAIRADWANQKCHPGVIPFAGFINKPEDMSAFEFTEQNFAECTNQMVIPVTLQAINPFSYIVDAFLAIYSAMAAALNAIREVIEAIRKAIVSFINEILGRFSNFIVPIIQLILTIKDTMSRVTGVLTVGQNVAGGMILTMKSLLGSVLQIVINLLIAMLGVMIGLIIILVASGFFSAPVLIPILVVMTVTFISISIPLLIMVVFLQDYMGVHADGTIPSAPAVPMPPSCFDKNTALKMADGTYKTIEQVCVGEELYHDGKITAKFKVDASNKKMYNLNNTFVSGSHYVYLDSMKTWVKVENYEDRVLIENYTEPFLYCLNTTSKMIVVNDTTYLDWDDLTEIDKQVSHKTDDLEKFHKHLDGGFAENTKVVLKTGETKSIKDIQVNDVLLNGERVYGLVEIDGTTVSHQYFYESCGFIGGSNLNFVNIDAQKVSKQIMSDDKPCDKLYHLLTDKKTFQIGKVNVYDYNSCIDLFLRVKI